MNSKKNVFYLFLGILLLIVVYNFIYPYFSVQNSSGMRMGMGMHGGRELSNNNIYSYNLIPNIIIIMSVVLVIFIIVNKVLFNSSKAECEKCGTPIESKQWKICPRCGQHLQNIGGKGS